METSPIDESNFFYPEDPPDSKDTPLWQTAGKTAFYSCTAIATGAFLPVLFGKKKKMIPSLSPPPILSLPSLEPPLQSDPEPAAMESAQPQRAPYAPPNDDHKKHIAFIVTFIGKNSLFKIGWEHDHLYKRGDLIDHIHPFEFLETIFSDDSLRQHMRPIWEEWTGFKRGGFMKGVNKGMSRDEKTLLHHLPAFARRLKVSPALLRPCIERREWEKFVLCLIENVRAP